MIREDEILLMLYNDSWFRPNKSVYKKPLTDKQGNPILDKNGKQLEVPQSYYKTLKNGTTVIIRISNHGTDLDTWVKHNPDPTQSLQNASIVFSNELKDPELTTYPYTYKDANNKYVTGYRYFVVEEFSYNIKNYDLKGIQRVIQSIKDLEIYDDNSQPVFADPYENNSKKRAGIRVLTPQDEYHRDIPSTNNPVHPRQTQVAQDNKIQKESCNKRSKAWVTENEIIQMIKESVEQIIDNLWKRRVGKFWVISGDSVEQKPIGLESRPCYVQQAKIYYNKRRVIALWRRCDNFKYFYAELKNIKDEDEGWKPLTISEVPIEIRNDCYKAKL